MPKDLYVRVKPKSQSKEFFRGGIQHTLVWKLLLGLDQATVQVLETEQMLETSEEKPADFDDQPQEATAVEETPQVLIGSDVLQPVIAQVGGFEITLGDLVAQAHVDSELSLTDWNGLPQAARNLLLDGKLFGLYKSFLETNGLSLGLVEPAVAEFKTALEAKIAEVTALTETVTGLQAKLQAAQTPASADGDPQVTKPENKTATKAAPKSGAK